MSEPRDDVSVVLFDLGRVLVDIDFDAFPRELGLVRSQVNHTDEQSVHAMAAAYETGRMGTEEFLDSLEKIFDKKYSRIQLVGAWNAIIKEENPVVARLVSEIRKKCVVALLSNTSPSHIQKALAISPVVRMIKPRFLSFEIGAMKPDPAVYRHVISHLSVDPGSILFIDDIDENVRAAEQCGMKGVVYHNGAQLREKLVRVGVLPEIHGSR